MTQVCKQKLDSLPYHECVGYFVASDPISDLEKRRLKLVYLIGQLVLGEVFTSFDELQKDFSGF